MAPEKKYNTRENAAQKRAAAAAEKKEKAAKERKDKAAPSTAFMDPKLWRTLQNYVDLLENLYLKLPLESFFALRAVCKSWYAVACKRMALKEPQLHKPFFTLYTRGGRFYRLDGILTYNKASKCKPGRRRSAKALHQPAPLPALEYNPVWAWKRRGDAEDLVPSSHQIVASEGLVCRHYPYHSGVLYLQVTVHDWNLPDEKDHVPRSFRGNARSRGVSRVPHYGPEQTVLGMMVLKQGENDHHAFQIVLGSLERDTQVFDSGSQAWETKPCRPNVRGGELRQTTGCAACQGRVYITMEYTREILVYDFGSASWSSLDAPPAPCAPVSTQPLHYCNDTLGAWNGRIMDVVDDADASSLSLWELVVGAQAKWRVFARMPADLYRWFRFQDDARVTVHASFCGEYVLVYSWFFMCESAKRYCLYNMATEVWQKVDVDGLKTSQKTVYIKRRRGSDDWDGWDK